MVFLPIFRKILTVTEIFASTWNIFCQTSAAEHALAQTQKRHRHLIPKTYHVSARTFLKWCSRPSPSRAPLSEGISWLKDFNHSICNANAFNTVLSQLQCCYWAFSSTLAGGPTKGWKRAFTTSRRITMAGRTSGRTSSTTMKRAVGRRTRYSPRTHTCIQTVPFVVKVIKANQKDTFVHTYTTVKSDVQYLTATLYVLAWSWDVLVLIS